MKKLLASLIVLLLAVIPVTANLVQNGGFEEPHYGGEAYKIIYDGETIGAWDVTSSDLQGVLHLYDTDGPAGWADINFAEGTQMLHIGESTRLNTISQTISGLTPGTTYEIMFAAANYGPGYTPHEMLVQVYNSATDSYDLDENVPVAAIRDPSIWTDLSYQSVEFVGTGTDLDLMITNIGGTAFTIDDISMIPLSTAGTITPDDPMDVYESDPDGSAVQFGVEFSGSPAILPGDTVTVVVHVSDPNSGIPNQDMTINGSNTTIELQFTDADWNIPQYVTVKAVDDTIRDDAYAEEHLIHFSTRSALGDSVFGGVDGTDPNTVVFAGVLPVNVIDDEAPAILISKTSVSLTEDGTVDSYTIELQGNPSSLVTVDISTTCQATINGDAATTLTFDAGDLGPKTVNVAAVDDDMVEVSPHSTVITHVVTTDDPVYADAVVSDVDVSIEDDDARSWSFGDDIALPVTNYSFEDPSIANGGVQDFNELSPVPGGFDFWTRGEMAILNPDAGQWEALYSAGHRQAPDGGNILRLDGTTETYLDICDYVIEPGPVSYAFEVAIGVPLPADPEANVTLLLSSNDPYGRMVETNFSLSGADLVAGEWTDIKVCGFVEPDSSFVGGFISIGIEAQGVHVDNLRLSVGNHPCDGCYQNPAADLSGPDDQADCKVDLHDIAYIAANWLECNIYPDCMTSW